MKKIVSLLLSLCLAASLAACGAPASSAPASESASAPAAAFSAAVQSEAKPTTDPSGASIVLPDEIKSIAVMAPSITEIIIALGQADKIVAIDTQTEGQSYKELAAGLPAFDMMTPDAEQLAALHPDVVFVSGMSMKDGENPFQTLIDLGICFVTVPSSDSINGIYSDISFLGAALGETEKAAALNDTLKAEIDRIAAIGSTVKEKKSVYFEIAAAPYAYSFGSGVFLNEMIELIGATNVLADQTGWLSVESESAVAANPDVILTNVNYVDDAVGEIKSREGWGEVTAVKNGDVYYIDNMSSSLPNHNIVKALDEMAKAVYPDLYK